MIDMSRINIFEYLEYQQFLRAVYEENKLIDSSFSYRRMAREIGFTSPNYCKLLIDGERHIARRSFTKVFTALKMTRREQEYFAYLVEFSRAKEIREKNFYYGKIARFRSERSITEIIPEQFDYFTNWYNVAIRELLNYQSAPANPEEIAANLIPPITSEKASHAISLLSSMNLIQEEDGEYRTTSTLLNTRSEINSLAIRDFHRQMLSRAEESLDNTPVEKREFSAATLSLSEEGYQKLCERIREFREEALHIACDDRGVDRVMQLNMHLFPLSSEAQQ